jgi:peptidoglycan/LPS O-acetylase OafA/YrhL
MAIVVVLFAIAALGGAVLAYWRLRDRPLSVPLAVLHGLFAVAGFAALLVAALSAATSEPPGPRSDSSRSRPSAGPCWRRFTFEGGPSRYR